jgi:predicted unusual protein kinase regulating ubiquinone biosynthesis (AarF/ABC1/UbiB family)
MEIKFSGEKELSKVPKLCYRRCTDDAVVDEYLEGFPIHSCARHSNGKTTIESSFYVEKKVSNEEAG